MTTYPDSLYVATLVSNPETSPVFVPQLKAGPSKTSNNREFLAEFHALRKETQAILSRYRLTSSDLWPIAQFLDLVSAGYPGRSSPVFKKARIQLALYIERNPWDPALTEIAGRSVVLSDLTDPLKGPRLRRRWIGSTNAHADISPEALRKAVGW